MNRRTWTGVSLAALAGGLPFIVRAQEKEPQKPDCQPVFKWAPRGYDKVVAYRFSDAPNESLIQRGTVNEVQLGQNKLKSAALSAEQLTALLKAATGGPEITDPFACYNPHHIFVFYRGRAVVGAFEVCFSCRQGICLPAAGKLHAGPDFRALARLCEATVGLVDGKSADEFIRSLDEEEKKGAPGAGK